MKIRPPRCSDRADYFWIEEADGGIGIYAYRVGRSGKRKKVFVRPVDSVSDAKYYCRRAGERRSGSGEI